MGTLCKVSVRADGAVFPYTRVLDRKGFTTRMIDATTRKLSGAVIPQDAKPPTLAGTPGHGQPKISHKKGKGKNALAAAAPSEPQMPADLPIQPAPDVEGNPA
jgi:hypothetical protein